MKHLVPGQLRMYLQKVPTLAGSQQGMRNGMTPGMVVSFKGNPRFIPKTLHHSLLALLSTSKKKVV